MEGPLEEEAGHADSDWRWAGKGPDEYASEALLQFIEDREDYEDAVEISRRVATGEEKTYTPKEVERQLGLDV